MAFLRKFSRTNKSPLYTACCRSTRLPCQEYFLQYSPLPSDRRDYLGHWLLFAHRFRLPKALRHVSQTHLYNTLLFLQFDDYLTWNAGNIYLYVSTREFTLRCRLFFISCSWKIRVTTKRWCLTTNIHGVTYQRRQVHRCDKQNPHHYIFSSLFAFFP